MSIRTHLPSSLGYREAQTSSFVSSDLVLDPSPGGSIQADVTFGVGLAASGIAQASVDGVRWSDLSGTAQDISINGSYLWVLTGLEGIRRVRLSVTLTGGIADFNIIAGVG